MSNWIGDAPPLGTHDDLEKSDRRRARRVPLTIGITILLLTLGSRLGYAHDPSHPELKAWFESLKSEKGPCCSDADGTAVSNVDWQSANGHYRVRLDGEWIDVPDEAVITEPNRVAEPWCGRCAAIWARPSGASCQAA